MVLRLLWLGITRARDSRCYFAVLSFGVVEIRDMNAQWNGMLRDANKETQKRVSVREVQGHWCEYDSMI